MATQLSTTPNFPSAAAKPNLAPSAAANNSEKPRSVAEPPQSQPHPPPPVYQNCETPQAAPTMATKAKPTKNNGAAEADGADKPLLKKPPGYFAKKDKQAEKKEMENLKEDVKMVSYHHWHLQHALDRLQPNRNWLVVLLLQDEHYLPEDELLRRFGLDSVDKVSLAEWHRFLHFYPCAQLRPARSRLCGNKFRQFNLWLSIGLPVRRCRLKGGRDPRNWLPSREETDLGTTFTSS